MDSNQIKEAVTSNGGSVVLAFAVLGVVSIAAVRFVKSIKTARETTTTQQTAPTEPMQTQERPITPDELAEATGQPGKPTYIAVKDPYSSKITVFDVSSAKDFYGPEGPYNVFTGKDATYGLAKSSLDPSNVTGDISNLTESEKDTHIQWHAKFSSKYPIVGYLVVDGSAAQEESESVVTSETKKDA